MSENKVVVLVVDMQEGAWKAVPDPQASSESMRTEFQRNSLQDDIIRVAEDRRLRGMEMLAPDISSFTDEMRGNGAQIVWCLMDNMDDLPGTDYGGLFKQNQGEGDIVLHKTKQSVLPENRDFFSDLKQQADMEGRELEIKVCGLWVGECVASNVIGLHHDGYNVNVVGDLILSSMKPCLDSERPDQRESEAISHMGERTGLGNSVSKWSEDILREQKEPQNRKGYAEVEHTVRDVNPKI